MQKLTAASRETHSPGNDGTGFQLEMFLLAEMQAVESVPMRGHAPRT